jgi:glycosyltransferase involved in cell wall biosynthesis
MAAAIGRLLSCEPLRACLARNAAADAVRRFDVDRQIDRHLEWYREIIAATADANGHAGDHDRGGSQRRSN